MTAHVEVFRYGARWCETCDTSWSACTTRAALQPPPVGCEGITIETANLAAWLVCPCGVVGPRRTGDPDDAWAAAAADRARHLAGLPIDPTPVREISRTPEHEELLLT